MPKGYSETKKVGRPKKVEQAAEELGMDLKDTSFKDMVASLFKNDYNEPFMMTEGQEEIFAGIFTKGECFDKKRLHVMTYTQYGKSDTVAMAVLLRACTFGDKWAIVAPSQAKARIILGYIIKHIFENDFTLNRFKLKEGESMENVRRERSKNRLTFDCGGGRYGEIFILSAESRIKGDDVGNSLMGFGAPNVVMDEAALISDESDAKAMRMVGGFTDAGLDFVCKIGNPFTRNHFLQAFLDKAYHKINIDYKRGIKEGRLTKEFIEEMKRKPYFQVLYANLFPAADDIDSKGWTPLISEEEVRAAMVTEEQAQHVGDCRLGNDVARGGSNKTTWTKRSMTLAELLARSNERNLTEVSGKTLFFMREHDIKDTDVFIDDIGVGGGAVDPLTYQGYRVNGVNVQNKAQDQTRFANLRAEAYWRAAEWVRRGGKLLEEDGWYQLCDIKYKPDSKGRLRVMSKDDMRALGIDSPDEADSLMLTFARKEHKSSEDQERRKLKRRRRNKSSGLRLNMGAGI